MSNLQHFTTRENTRIFKGFHGWQGETTVNIAGQDWKITTLKRHDGFIGSTAVAVEGREDGSFTYMPLTAKSHSLMKVSGKATEKLINDTHYEALAKFDAMHEGGQIEEKAPYQIKPGQLFRFLGYGYEMQIKYVCYDISTNSWGTTYKVVDIKEKSFSTVEHPRLVSEKFGIGTYYNEGEVMGEDELSNLLIEVAQLEKQRVADKEQAEKKANTAQATAIEAGSKILPSIPEGVKALIIAELMEDDSDTMSDYFASHSTKVIILAFSTHTRDLFPEMRKAALNCPDTAYLATEGEEHREKYSMGEGYYIGARRSGWRISKLIIRNEESVLKKLQQAAGEGRYFIKEETRQQVNPVSAAPGSVEILDYSEKAFAVVGDTKPIKDILKNLGGKWNSHLKCGAGWIFSKKYYLVVNKAIGLA